MIQTNKKSKVSIKFFIGFIFTHELRMHLSRNHDWQQALIDRNNSNDTLIECPYQDKFYIGQQLDSQFFPVKEIMLKAQTISSILQKYCPDLEINIQSCHFFPLILVA